MLSRLPGTEAAHGVETGRAVAAGDDVQQGGGLAVHGDARPDAGPSEGADECGRRIVGMVWEDLRPSRILTRGAFQNALAVQMGFDYAKTEAQAKSTASTTNISSTSSSGAGGTSILDRIATEQLKKSVSIPPVLYINQGANVQVMVVRDLDFSTVYGVEEKE